MNLTPTMQAALDAVTATPGLLVSFTPGGKNTIAALMRRGKVELDADQEHVYLPEHVHVFKTTMHLDGCHHYSSSFVCECGVIGSSYGERSIKADPYSAVWMDDPDVCERCAALLHGARPAHEVVIQRPRNYVPPGAVAA